MKSFKISGAKLSYKDTLQIDGVFSVTHINYGKSPIFDGFDSKNLAYNSRKDSLSSKEKITDIIESIELFDGTEKDLKKEDQILLWESYWKEYVQAFDKLASLLPKSVVTVNIGRHAIEIGFKFLLLKKTGQIPLTHNLEELSDLLFNEYKIDDSYMQWVDVFCKKYCQYIEGGNAEYFRYPEYKKNKYFAGNNLDIEWLIYNFALIILKLFHFSGLDVEV